MKVGRGGACVMGVGSGKGRAYEWIMGGYEGCKWVFSDLVRESIEILMFSVIDYVVTL